MFKFYYDLMSQPSRALWIAFKMKEVSYEDCPVALRKQEQLSEEYKKINRFQKVPAIVEDDFHLSESIAILRYLAGRGIFGSLYPLEPRQQARVDEFLEWQHLEIRYGCGNYFLRQWLLPMRGHAKPPSELERIQLVTEMEKKLKILDEIWLQKYSFICGSQLTMADLFGASELEQTRLCQYNVKQKFPKIGKWLNRVRESTNPYYDEAHMFIYKMSQKAKN